MKKFSQVAVGCVFAGAFALGCGLLKSPTVQAQAPQQTRVIHVADGDVQGSTADAVDEFLGIPYAAPPLGDCGGNRRKHLRRGRMLQATKFANTCAQQQRGVFAAPSKSEDRLYLNLYASHPGAGGDKQPVMVWFHGGGLFSGESNDYDGSKLAKRGHVVVVTLNYRVGVFGFLSHPAINNEGHSAINYGIMDQQLALRWVQKNIAAFRRRSRQCHDIRAVRRRDGRHGEPGFAAIEGAVSPRHQRKRHAHRRYRCRNGLAGRQGFGCGGRMRGSERGLLARAERSNRFSPTRRRSSNIWVRTFPVVDGTVITHTAFAAFSTGEFNRVPIMNGLVEDEQAFFLPEANTHKPLTNEDVKDYAASFGSEHADTLLKKYPLAEYASPSLAEIAMAQGMKSCVARLLDRTMGEICPGLCL